VLDGHTAAHHHSSARPIAVRGMVPEPSVKVQHIAGGSGEWGSSPRRSGYTRPEAWALRARSAFRSARSITTRSTISSATASVVLHNAFSAVSLAGRDDRWRGAPPDTIRAYR
jgi:hypothetical protein